MTFGAPDRPASGDYFAYDSTQQRWEREGLPPGVDLNEYFGMDFDPFQWRVPANLAVLPRYERVVVEETEEYQTVRTGGEVVKKLKNVPPARHAGVDQLPSAIPCRLGRLQVSAQSRYA